MRDREVVNNEALVAIDMDTDVVVYACLADGEATGCLGVLLVSRWNKTAKLKS
jgi:hypothetical protein